MDLRLSEVPPADLVDLYRHRSISEREYQAAIEWATKPPARDRWAGYLRDWFLVFGVLLLVAGVIVFGAYNWQALHRFAKLGILQLLVVAAWGGSRLRHPDSIESKVMLWGAALLVGAMLAVFGQIYQTGADAYTLFLSWSVLIAPWSLAGRSNLLWLTQAVLLNLTFVLFSQQVGNNDFAVFSLAYAAFNLALAALWEAARRKAQWLAPGLTDALLANGSAPLTAAACLFFWDSGLYLMSLALLVGLHLFLVFRFGRQVRRMAIVAFSAVCVGAAFLSWLLQDLHSLGFLLVAAGVIAEVTAATAWLKRVNGAVLPSAEASAPQSGVARANLIQVLAEAGLLDATPPPEEREVARGTPKYVSLLTAFGAWLSSWFLLAFVVVGVSDSEGGMILIGSLLWVASIFGRRSEGAKWDFFAYTCLAVNLAGQLLTVIGVATSDGATTQIIAGTALLLHLVSLCGYKDGLGRCLFAFASVVSGSVFWHETLGRQGWSVWLLLIAFMLSRLLIGQRGWLLSRWRYWHGAVAFGGCCGLLTMASVWGFGWTPLGAPDPVFLAVGLTLLAAACAVRLQAPLSAVLALLLLGALTFTMPGFMAALLVFILAFHTRSLGVSWLSVMALLFFGVLYYYNLDLTFLAKSATLIASGLLLLIARSSLRPQAVQHAF